MCGREVLTKSVLNMIFFVFFFFAFFLCFPPKYCEKTGATGGEGSKDPFIVRKKKTEERHLF